MATAAKQVKKMVDTGKEAAALAEAGKDIMFDAIIEGTIYMLGAWVSFRDKKGDDKKGQRVYGWLRGIYWLDPTHPKTGMSEAEPDPIPYEFEIDLEKNGKRRRFVGSEIKDKKVECYFQKQHGYMDPNHHRFFVETVAMYRDRKVTEDAKVFAEKLSYACESYSSMKWKVDKPKPKTPKERGVECFSAAYLMGPEPPVGMIPTFEAQQDGRTYIVGMPVFMCHPNKGGEVWDEGIIVMILKGSKGVCEGPYKAVVAYPKNNFNFGFETVSLDKLVTHEEYENGVMSKGAPTVDMETLDAYYGIVNKVREKRVPVDTTEFTKCVLEYRDHVFEYTYVKKIGCIYIKTPTLTGNTYAPPFDNPGDL